jgi:hypothetical protein
MLAAADVSKLCFESWNACRRAGLMSISFCELPRGFSEYTRNLGGGFQRKRRENIALEQSSACSSFRIKS